MSYLAGGAAGGRWLRLLASALCMIVTFIGTTTATSATATTPRISQPHAYDATTNSPSPIAKHAARPADVNASINVHVDGLTGGPSALPTLFVAAETGGAASVRLGQAGEAAVRAQYDIGAKATRVINGRTRIFDGLTDGAVSEVKNVGRLSNTQQLRDYASQNGLRLDIYVRGNTQISGPLARLDLDPNSPVNIIRALP